MRTSGWIGLDESAPAGPPMWLCVSTRPHYHAACDVSNGRPEGAFTVAEGPMAVILPLWTTIVPFSMGEPTMGIMRALTKATGASWAKAEQVNAIVAKKQIRNDLIFTILKRKYRCLFGMFSLSSYENDVLSRIETKNDDGE